MWLVIWTCYINICWRKGLKMAYFPKSPVFFFFNPPVFPMSLSRAFCSLSCCRLSFSTAVRRSLIFFFKVARSPLFWIPNNWNRKNTTNFLNKFVLEFLKKCLLDTGSAQCVETNKSTKISTLIMCNHCSINLVQTYFTTSNISTWYGE